MKISQTDNWSCLPRVEKVRVWIDALRSGRYLQGRQALCAADDSKHLRYCCLGVLAEEARRMGAPIARQLVEAIPGYSKRKYRYSIVGRSAWDGGFAPRDLFWDVLPFAGGVDQSDFVQMNDGLHLSFKQIADYLEKNHAR